jgi:isopentenyl-diphosphate delta-isomerase
MKFVPTALNTPQESVILVDRNDKQVGISEKYVAHQYGLRHRAFSVFIYDTNGHMLIQRRSMMKYHGKGEWANAACGHPRPGERVCAAAKRRLKEEMGLEVATLDERLTYIYRVPMKEGLIEHEYLHVLVGNTDKQPDYNKDEVMEVAWMYPEAINSEIVTNGKKYAFWFKESMNRLYSSEKF